MARPTTSRGRRSLAVLAAAATGVSGMALFAPGTSIASSHREAPYTQGDPRIDNTDVYSFVSPDDPDTVTLVANFYPFQEPDGGPNFYRFDENAQYDIKVDNDGDALPDVTYRWTFTTEIRNPDTFLYNTGVVESLDDEDLNVRQTYDLVSITGDGLVTPLLDDAPVAPSNVGPTSMPDYETLRDEAITPIVPGVAEAGGQSFAGQADDPFFLDLRVFDLLYGAPQFDEVGNDTLNGRNVQSIALQLPKAAVALNASPDRNPVIGVWSTTQRRSTRVLSTDGSGTQTQSGDFVQVSRLGMPLVNEVVIPIKDKDRFNRTTPVNDETFLSYVNDPEVPKLIDALYGIEEPDTDDATDGTQREDLVEIFLTGVCTEATGCPGGVPALEADLNSQLVNEDVDAATFQASEMQRLNMAVPPSNEPNRLGVLGGDFAGFPNGRRLTDDVIDIELQVLEGELLGNANDLGDAVDSNDVPFEASFPYVALPHDGAVNLARFTGFERLAGENRFGTAADIAIKTFGSAAEGEGTDTVLLASGLDRNLPDSLAGNFLAGVEDAPILLTTPGELPDVTRRALDTLGAENIIILGGTSAVSAAQEAELNDSRDVERIGGRDRYETAAKIATSRPDAVGEATAIVARGDQFADALVAGPIAFRQGFPVLLTRPTGAVDAFTRAALDQLDTERVIVAGGPAAVSDATVATIEDARGNDTVAVERIFGGNRQLTAVAIAQFATGELGFPRLHVNLARGDNGADALTGGPHAGREGSVILLTVNPSTLGAAAQGYLADESTTLQGGHLFGGAAALSAVLVAEATDAANSNDSVELARIQEEDGDF